MQLLGLRPIPSVHRQTVDLRIPGLQTTISGPVCAKFLHSSLLAFQQSQALYTVDYKQL